MSQNLGADAKWGTINSAVWSSVTRQSDHALTLTEVDAVAKSASAKPNEVLAVLALLSRPAARLLKMEYFANGGEGSPKVPRNEVGKRLTAWWKDKTMSQDEWRSWARNVVVKWSPVDVEGPTQ